MAWHKILFLVIFFAIIVMGFLKINAKHNGTQDHHLLSIPQTEPIYAFTEEELEQVRAEAKAGEAWNGACEDKSFWYVDDAINASAAIAASYGGNVFAMICEAKMSVHDLTPQAMTKSYRLYSTAIAMQPGLPDPVIHTRAQLEYFVDDFGRRHVPEQVSKAHAKYVAAKLDLPRQRFEETMNGALEKLPFEADTRRVLDQYQKKLEYWRTHCVTLADISDRENIEIHGIYSVIEGIARNGSIAAMVCAARFYPLNYSTLQNSTAYYWYAFALLANPGFETVLAVEKKAVAETLARAEIEAQEEYAANSYSLMLDSESYARQAPTLNKRP